MSSIGQKIKNIRTGLGLTVGALSEELGVSRSYLTLMENGKRRLQKGLVGKLAKAFGLPKETVYDWYLEQELREVGIKNKKSHESAFERIFSQRKALNLLIHFAFPMEQFAPSRLTRP